MQSTIAEQLSFKQVESHLGKDATPHSTAERDRTIAEQRRDLAECSRKTVAERRVAYLESRIVALEQTVSTALVTLTTMAADAHSEGRLNTKTLMDVTELAMQLGNASEALGVVLREIKNRL